MPCAVTSCWCGLFDAQQRRHAFPVLEFKYLVLQYVDFLWNEHQVWVAKHVMSAALVTNDNLVCALLEHIALEFSHHVRLRVPELGLQR